MAAIHPPTDPVDRILARVTVTRLGCWESGFVPKPDGYVSIGDSRSGRKVTYLAHRVMYEHFTGPIPEGLEIDHLCRVRHCMNPGHMEAVTHLENLRRRLPKTRCPADHPYEGNNLYVRPDGARICRTCTNESARKYRAKATV